jgi:hypothetical protein
MNDLNGQNFFFAYRIKRTFITTFKRYKLIDKSKLKTIYYHVKKEQNFVLICYFKGGKKLLYGVLCHGINTKSLRYL